MNPGTEYLRACLPSLAERTGSQLRELYRDTTEDRADIAARAIYEVYTVLRKLSAGLADREPPTT